MLAIFSAAFLLGAIFNIAPGAIFAESIRRGTTGGFRPALDVQLGSLAGDALWAVLGLLGVGLLLRAEILQIPIGVAGASYLLYLAWDSWRSADQPEIMSSSAASLSPLRSGVILSVTNPQNVVYWAALGSAFGAIGISAPQTEDYVVFFAGFMASSLLWCFVCAALIERLFSNRGRSWKKWTYRLCAVAFAYLGLGTLWEVAARITG